MYAWLSMDKKTIWYNRPFHVKQWNVGSRLIRRDVTAGVHFSAILLQIYIAAYGKMGKL